MQNVGQRTLVSGIIFAHLNQVFLLIGLLLLYVPCNAAGEVTFSDGTFNLGDYNITTYSNLPPPDTVTLSQNTSGGNPGDFLAQNFSLTGAVQGAEVVSALINKGWTYNPSMEGAISGINFSIDKFTSTTFTSEAGTLAALQDGKFYIFSVLGTVDVGAWETIAKEGITASSGWEVVNLTNGIISPGAPNFTPNGDPLSFGFAIGATGTLSGVFTAGADNVFIGITPVPEPSGLITLGTVIFLFGLVKLSRRTTVGNQRELPQD